MDAILTDWTLKMIESRVKKRPPRLALFGGAFDPPHLGHAHILESLQKQYPCDLIIVMPTGTPPHKQATTTPSYHRLAMAYLAFVDTLPLPGQLPGQVQISPWELNRTETSYTYHTVTTLSAQCPQWEIVLLVGGDSLRDIHKWYQFKYLLDNCTLAATGRSGIDLDIKAINPVLIESFNRKPKLVPLIEEPPPWASSDIRRNKDIWNKALCPAVFQYLKNNNLYDR